jgi:hypothetical protein
MAGFWLAIGLFAFLSMFRNPLLYFARRPRLAEGDGEVMLPLVAGLLWLIVANVIGHVAIEGLSLATWERAWSG